MKLNPAASGALLIIGTSIGAGMLALPIVTSPAGLWGAFFCLAVCWFAMLLAGFFVLEVSTWLPKGTHLISMAKITLGPVGKWVAGLSYLALLYTLMAAYLSGGAGLLQGVTTHMPAWFGSAIWVVVAALLVYLGPKYIDIFNRMLMIGLVFAYLVLIVVTTPHVHAYHFSQGHFFYFWRALPVVITAFGYHVIIPSIRSHFSEKTADIVKALIWGTLISLLVYMIWQLLVIGTIPLYGHKGLVEVLQSKDPAAHLASVLASVMQSTWVDVGIRLFVIFAIATSYLGISFALFDFICDVFHAREHWHRRLLALVLTFLPAFIYAITYQKGFLLALTYAGIFVAILHGIVPTWMVWAGRYRKLTGNYRSPGGNLSLLFVFVFSLFIIAVDLFK